MSGRVVFVGAGPGDPELLTIKAARLLSEADLVLYADSLVSGDIAQFIRPGVELVGTSDLTLEQVMSRMLPAAREGKLVVRVHSGDPSIYGAIHEQMARLDQEGIEYEIVPGVSAAFAAAAQLKAELTVPEIAQTVILTRLPGRTIAVDRERLRDLARHGATMAIFLSVTAIERVVEELLSGGYSEDTPAAVVYRASWPDQRVLRGTLEDIGRMTRAAGLKRQALVLVGRALDPAIRRTAAERRSRLYSAQHAHIFRPGASSDGAE